VHGTPFTPLCCPCFLSVAGMSFHVAGQTPKGNQLGNGRQTVPHGLESREVNAALDLGAALLGVALYPALAHSWPTAQMLLPSQARTPNSTARQPPPRGTHMHFVKRAPCRPTRRALEGNKSFAHVEIVGAVPACKPRGITACSRS
jgi:hypothetical protein